LSQLVLVGSGIDVAFEISCPILALTEPGHHSLEFCAVSKTNGRISEGIVNDIETASKTPAPS
jgi:hypothetical protein